MSRKQQSSPAYAAMVESMDENIGRLLKSLKKTEAKRMIPSLYSFLIMEVCPQVPAPICQPPAPHLRQEKDGFMKEASVYL